MSNMREKIKVDPKETKKKEEKRKYDMAAYPFGAEEMLLKAELKDLDRDDR